MKLWKIAIGFWMIKTVIIVGFLFYGFIAHGATLAEGGTSYEEAITPFGLNGFNIQVTDWVISTTTANLKTLRLKVKNIGSTGNSTDLMTLKLRNPQGGLQKDCIATTTISTFPLNVPIQYDWVFYGTECSISSAVAIDFLLLLSPSSPSSFFTTMGSTTTGYYFIASNDIIEQETLNCSDPTTRILSFTPENEATTTSPVNFSLDACINEDDIGTIQGVNISLHNIDQNVILLSDFSPSDIWLLKDLDIQNSGLYSFSTTTALGDGNYRLEACIQRSYLWGFFNNPLAGISECESHQFVVGQGTFIGNISQNLWGETNDFYNGLTATSSEALAYTCNPLGGNFDVRLCLSYLFIPSGEEISETMQEARDAFLTRAPLGYFTRFINILTDTATTSLPSYTAEFQIGSGYTETPQTTTLLFDPTDVLAGASDLVETIEDPITGKKPREMFENMVKLTIALMVLLVIVSDLIGTYNKSNEDKGKV